MRRNRVLKEYADFLADPVCSILNSSFAEQRLPSQWKYADVTPLPKVKPVTFVLKLITPTLLTAALSKVVEDFVVHAYVSPAILEIVDPNQFGAIPKSCADALVSMLHTWAQATDGTSAQKNSTGLQEGIRLDRSSNTKWEPVPSGVPQGTKLGPWLFVLIINDLSPSDVQTWKYVDDTTLAEVIAKDGESSIQAR
ncbi:hypothetical protein ACROYT_G037598 [Oculina patagonica]